MKKIYRLFGAGICFLMITACADNNNLRAEYAADVVDNSYFYEYSESTTEELVNDNRGVDIDARVVKEDNMIRMIISPEYFGINENETSIKEQVRGWGANDISIDEAGYVSALISPDNYDAFVLSLKKQVIDTVNDIINDNEKYPSVTDIKYNSDFTRFDINCKSDITYEKSFASLDLYMVSAAYQVLSGVPQDEAYVDIYFIDNATGDIIEKIDTSDLVER